MHPRRKVCCSALSYPGQAANESTLRSFVDEADGLVFEGSEADFLLDQLRAKSVRPSKIAIPLSLGDPDTHPESSLSLTVHVYTKTMELKIPSAKKFSGVAEQLPEDQRSGEMFGGVDILRKYQLVQPDADDNVGGDEEGHEIDVEETIKAYRYGKTLVPFSEEDEAAMKLRTEKGLAILGFVKMTKVGSDLSFQVGAGRIHIFHVRRYRDMLSWLVSRKSSQIKHHHEASPSSRQLCKP